MPPAARVGDLTAHGGAIVAGAATVFIEGMPAARQGDMHVCPMVNPGTPPPPHVGGPVAMGSTTVFIEGLPAARMGDMCVCSGPPDTIAMGATTVMIGDSAGGGGGGGGGGGQGIGAKAAKFSAAAAESLTPEATELREPFLAAQVVCGATTPIAKAQSHVKDADGNESQRALPGNGQVLNGRLQSEGESEIAVQQLHSVRWSQNEARLGDEVTISGAAPGFPDGTEVLIRVEQLLSSGDGSDTVYVTTAEVSGETIEATWSYGQTFDGELSTDLDPDRPVRDQMPIYRAEIVVAEAGASRRSGLLTFQDRYRMQALSQISDEPVPNVPYKLLMTNGEVREGKTDADGWLDEDEVPPGDHDVLW